MKITQTAYVIATAVSTTNAISLRGLFKKQQQQQHTAADIVDDNSDEAWDAADTDTTAIVQEHKDRELQFSLWPGTNCQVLEGQSSPPAPKWFPNYSVAWTIGRKYHTVAGCSNSRPLPFTVGSRPVYDSQLECCKMAYGGQSSDACVNALPQPPTI